MLIKVFNEFPYTQDFINKNIIEIYSREKVLVDQVFFFFAVIADDHLWLSVEKYLIVY